MWFALFEGHTQRCSGLTPGSVLKDQAKWGSEDTMEFWGLTLGGPCAVSVPSSSGALSREAEAVPTQKLQHGLGG